MHAAECNIDFIETDVQVTKDNQFILFHDKILNKKTNLKGFVKKYTLEQLKNAKYTYFKNRNVALCSLEDLLDYISNQPNPKTRLILELKREYEKDAIKQLITLINLYKLGDLIIIDSFHLRNLKILREISNNIFISRLLKSIPPLKITHQGFNYLESIYKEIEKLDIQAISLHKDNIFPAIISFFKERSIFVFAWGVKDTSEYDKFLTFPGLNGFTASDPCEQLRKRRELLNY
jgi:glycerophosphoryl diester phosphodiesterase